MARDHVRRRGGSWQAIAYAGKDPDTGKKRYVARTAPTKRDAEATLLTMLTDLQDQAGPDGEAIRRQREAELRASAARLEADQAALRAEREIRSALTDLDGVRWRDGLEVNGSYVYCLWSDDRRRPLYIGKSTNVLCRLGTHLSDTERRAQVQRVTLVKCSTAEQMDDTERRLIAEHQPPLNVKGVLR